MKKLLNLIKFELLMQSRSFVIWIVLGLLLIFLFFDISQTIQYEPMQQSSDISVIYSDKKGNVIDSSNWATEEKEALERKPFSYFRSIQTGERIGLFISFFFGFITPFVFSKDNQHGLIEVINSKDISSAQYVLSKTLSLLIIAFVYCFISFVFVSIYTFQVAKDFSLSYQFSDFIIPTFINLLVTTFYIISFITFISVLINSGVGGLIVHIIYWFLCMTQMNIIASPVDYRLLLVWLIRYPKRISPTFIELLNLNKTYLFLNRTIYIILFIGLIVLTCLVFDRRRNNGDYKRVQAEE